MQVCEQRSGNVGAGQSDRLSQIAEYVRYIQLSLAVQAPQIPIYAKAVFQRIYWSLMASPCAYYFFHLSQTSFLDLLPSLSFFHR